MLGKEIKRVGFKSMLVVFLVTTAWHLLRLLMEETASRYGD
jgi:hypothetical protein